MNVHSIGVVPVSLRETGEYLFLIVKHKAGHWSFPKGTPEVGESEEETARRELYEETGIKDVEIRTDKQFREEYSFMENNILKHKTVTYYIGFASDNGTKTLPEFENEISEIRWLPYDKAHELLTYIESKDMLEEVKMYLAE